MPRLILVLESAVTFACCFYVAAYYVAPRLPPYPPPPRSAFDPILWTANWSGLLLGILGAFHAIRRLRRGRARVEAQRPQP